MDIMAVVPTFLLAVLLISASPGPAVALIFRRAALRGFRSALGTVLGPGGRNLRVGTGRRERACPPSWPHQKRHTSYCG
jgi:hypothetical protein